MYLVNPYAKIVPQEEGLLGAYKAVEKAARVSYRSEDRISETSWKKMLYNLLNAGHMSPLEFGTVYLKFTNEEGNQNPYLYFPLINNPFSRATTDSSNWYITTNLRVLYENELPNGKKVIESEELLDKVCDKPCPEHILRVNTHWLCDRAIGEEALRHREIVQISDYPEFSWMKESTRFCNYSADGRFGGVRFCIPTMLPFLKEGEYTDVQSHAPHITFKYRESPDRPFAAIRIAHEQTMKYFLFGCRNAEKLYLSSLEEGLKPQIARMNLSLSVAGEFYMCGFVDAGGWRNFFELRREGKTGKPHPDMQYLADMLYKQFSDMILLK